MADYIYLLENRLSPAQKQALVALREIARGRGLTLFLVGGAVRDLTSGSPVRDLDVAVQGNASKLRKDMELAGGVVVGTNDPAQALYLRFPGGVRVEVGSTMSAHYPKPGKPVLKPGTILEDMRRRDFTANAMALSLNEGSYGLLMDPLNGVADIENRELRLVSNYGFIEEPVRLIRAARFAARLGWTLEEKTRARYETGKQEGYIAGLQEFHRGYEAEEIVHEEDPLRVMRRLEAEGWMEAVSPAWNSSKANVAELEKVRESQTQLQLQGVHPDAATVHFPLLTAKMAAKDVQALKKMFARPGFVAEIEALEGEAKDFATQLGGKGVGSASASYRMLHAAKPEAVLYVAYTTKNGALQAKFKSFFGEWPQVRQKIPLALMAEMRITPELPGYDELVEKLFFELMDGNLSTVEEMRAFLEPYSPPAPPPPVHLRRPRAARKDARKGRSKKGAAVASEDEEDAEDVDLDETGQDGDDGEDGDDSGPNLPMVLEEEEDLDEDVDEHPDVVTKEQPEPVVAGANAEEALREKAAGAEKAAGSAKGGDKASATSSGVDGPGMVQPPTLESKGNVVQHAPGGSTRGEAIRGAVPFKAPAEKAATVKVVAAAAPAKDAPIKTAPAKTVPIKTAPAKTVPIKTAPAKTVLVKAAPAKTAPAKAAPTKAAPVKTAPAKTVLVKAAPAKAAPAKTAPAKTAPAKTASAKTVLVKAAPAKSAPAKTASAKSTPAKTAPAKTAPAKAAPVKSASVKAAMVKGLEKRGAGLNVKAGQGAVAAKAPAKRGR